MFSGPVIRDVTHDLNEDIASFPSNIEQPKTPAAPTQASTSSSSVVAVDPKLIQHGDGSSGSSAPQVVKTSANKRPVLTRELSREDLDEDVNKVRTCASIEQENMSHPLKMHQLSTSQMGVNFWLTLPFFLCSISRFTTTLST